MALNGNWQAFGKGKADFYFCTVRDNHTAVAARV